MLITVHLHRRYFGELERPLVSHGSLSASTFLFESGVHGLRLKSDRVDLLMLPFQGQQIWRAVVDGRDLTMGSMFSEPRPTTDYLRTYGGFLIHCGVTAMGVPGEGDTHPLHGELPNAPFDKAYVVVGEDERGAYIGLGGEYQHTVAFSHNYAARPLVKVYEGSARFTTELEIHNLKRTEMELMYMAHINFKPVDNGRLVYSAPADPEHVRVRKSIPPHVTPKAGYREWLEHLSQHPEEHHVLKPGLPFDPEVVFLIDYLADEGGWAHTMQVRPDGSADYMRHRPEELDTGVRWICRTTDQDALGMTDPATAEPEGYSAEKAKGNLKTVPAGGVWRCEVEMGVLAPAEVEAMETQVEGTLGGG